MKTKAEVIDALRVLFYEEHIDDDVYRVRESELLGWEGPRVVAYSEACRILLEFLKEQHD